MFKNPAVLRKLRQGQTVVLRVAGGQQERPDARGADMVAQPDRHVALLAGNLLQQGAGLAGAPQLKAGPVQVWLQAVEARLLRRLLVRVAPVPNVGEPGLSAGGQLQQPVSSSNCSATDWSVFPASATRPMVCPVAVIRRRRSPWSRRNSTEQKNAACT